MTRNGGTLVYRVEQLEKKVDILDGKMDRLLENHVPKIELDIMSIKTRVNVVTAINIGAIIMGIIVGRILR